MSYSLCHMLLLLIVCMGSQGQRPTVTISDGTLAGITIQTWHGRPISAFLSVPFARPPLGPLRFAPPQPVVPWQGTRDAGTSPEKCTQYLGTNIGVLGQEDCLYLDVYVPQMTLAEGKSLPVIVFLFPGAFNLGGANAYGPRYLLDYDVLLVIPNYRLGVLGFLTTGDSQASGNMGLKDQLAALQWVKANIKAFGGNPSDVTLTGGSAGGQSVTYHLISKMSQGLFKRAITMSGSCLQPSAQQKAPIYKTTTLAQSFNCPTNSSTELVSCLRSIPAREIAARESIFQYFYYSPIAVFGPIVEPDVPGAFITQGPYQRLRTGEVFQGPVLFSSSTQEGLVPGLIFLANETGVSYANTNWLQVAPSLLDFSYTVTSENLNTVSLKIREYYFGNQPISYATNQTIIQMMGDRTWANDVETNARIQAYVQPFPIHFYHFGYRGEYSMFNFDTGSTLNFGVGHLDDLLYILNSTTYPPAENTPSDRAMIGVMTRIWANFAINGTISAGPDIDWMPINRADAMNGPMNYLMIHSPESLTPGTTLTFAHPQFWNNLPINEPGSGRPAFYLNSQESLL